MAHDDWDYDNTYNCYWLAEAAGGNPGARLDYGRLVEANVLYVMRATHGDFLSGIVDAEAQVDILRKAGSIGNAGIGMTVRGTPTVSNYPGYTGQVLSPSDSNVNHWNLAILRNGSSVASVVNFDTGIDSTSIWTSWKFNAVNFRSNCSATLSYHNGSAWVKALQYIDSSPLPGGSAGIALYTGYTTPDNAFLYIDNMRLADLSV